MTAMVRAFDCRVARPLAWSLSLFLFEDISRAWGGVPQARYVTTRQDPFKEAIPLEPIKGEILDFRENESLHVSRYLLLDDSTVLNKQWRFWYVRDLSIYRV